MHAQAMLGDRQTEGPPLPGRPSLRAVHTTPVAVLVGAARELVQPRRGPQLCETQEGRLSPLEPTPRLVEQRTLRSAPAMCA